METGEKVSLYSPRFEGEEFTEFERFLLTYKNSYTKDVQILIRRLDIIKEMGTEDRFFRYEGSKQDRVMALPSHIDTTNLRLYCLNICHKILILGNGGIKTTQTYQEDDNLHRSVQNLQKIDIKIKQLEKKKRRLQRSISRKYLKNKKGDSYCKTSNIIKSEKKLLKITHRLTNIRYNYMHQTTSEIIKREPSFICIEDLNVKGMMKNRHLSKAVQQQGFYEFRRKMEYKSKWNNIQVIIADRFFPSSKLCSCCGKIKKDLKLSERIYKCECGNVIDRDLQAALNLKKYGEDVLKRSVA